MRTLDEAGIRPALDHVFVNSDWYDYLSTLLRRQNPFGAPDASVLCFVNAEKWDIHVIDPGRIRRGDDHVEAVWAWELEHIPQPMIDIASNGDVQRVHALSNWSARAMAAVLPVPVERFAPFDLSLLDTLHRRSPGSTSTVPSDHYVLTTLDAKSYLSRKNPEGVLELWRRVLDDHPNHWLVIKSNDLRDFAPAELLDLIEATPRTHLIDYNLDDDEYFTLLSQCDVFVSLHRSEGMGLTPIEAGLCGLPVIYTNYGGVTEFMEDGFLPVSYTPTRVGESPHDSGPYESDAWWAEPDLDDAEVSYTTLSTS